MGKREAASILWVMAGAALVYLGRKSMGRIGDFVAKAVDMAKTVGNEYQLPPWLILTQATHESAAGTSGLTAKGNNLFGFTGEAWAKQGKPTVTMPTSEFIKGAWVKVSRPFRAYGSWADSMRDYARLLTTQPRYAEAVKFARAGDVTGTFAALGRSGYATDPTYGEKLQAVYTSVKKYLI